MNESRLRELIKSVLRELQEEELEEITVTGNVAGYNTPFAFSGNKGNKKKKKVSTNSTGYSVVKEAIDEKDIKIIKKLIRDVIADVYRDIWIKRTSWKQEILEMPNYIQDPDNSNTGCQESLINGKMMCPWLMKFLWFHRQILNMQLIFRRWVCFPNN